MKLVERKGARRSSMSFVRTRAYAGIRFYKKVPYYYFGVSCRMRFDDLNRLYETTSSGRIVFLGDRHHYRETPCRISYERRDPWGDGKNAYLIEMKMPKVAKRLGFNYQDYGYFRLSDGLDRIKRQFNRLKELI